MQTPKKRFSAKVKTAMHYVTHQLDWQQAKSVQRQRLCIPAPWSTWKLSRHLAPAVSTLLVLQLAVFGFAPELSPVSNLRSLIDLSASGTMNMDRKTYQWSWSPHSDCIELSLASLLTTAITRKSNDHTDLICSNSSLSTYSSRWCVWPSVNGARSESMSLHLSANATKRVRMQKTTLNFNLKAPDVVSLAVMAVLVTTLGNYNTASGTRTQSKIENWPPYPPKVVY